jgi:hypothetical protein
MELRGLLDRLALMELMDPLGQLVRQDRLEPMELSGLLDPLGLMELQDQLDRLDPLVLLDQQVLLIYNQVSSIILQMQI